MSTGPPVPFSVVHGTAVFLPLHRLGLAPQQQFDAPNSESLSSQSLFFSPAAENPLSPPLHPAQPLLPGVSE